MTRGAWVAFAALATARVAAAEPHHVMVLRAEGNADAGTRAKIDTQVLKLAKNLEGSVESGDISFSDATVAAGCASPNDAACKEELLSTMGLDELVVASVTGAPGGELKVNVKRLAKGQPTREASTTIAAGQTPDAKMNADIGPLFGLVSAAPPLPPPAEKPVVPPPVVAPPRPQPPALGEGSATAITAAPNNQIVAPPEGRRDSRRLEVTGLAVGGGLALLGVIFWAEASSTQSDINAAPTRTPKDFNNLQDMESRGDLYAALGNVMFIGGVAVATASGYFYWRDRRAHRAQQARIAPAVFDHGAGLTLSFGGGR